MEAHAIGIYTCWHGFFRPIHRPFLQGGIGQPFDGWLRMAVGNPARFNGLVQRLELIHSAQASLERSSALKKAACPFTSRQTAGLIALRGSPLEAG